MSFIVFFFIFILLYYDILCYLNFLHWVVVNCVMFSLLFYMSLNLVNVAQIVADNQYVRYTQALEEDIAQFEALNYPGYEKLIRIYEKEPSKQLRKVLRDKAKKEKSIKQNWQSYNFSRESWLLLYEEKVNQTPIEGEGK